MTYEANPLDLMNIGGIPYEEPTSIAPYVDLVNGWYQAEVESVEVKPSAAGHAMAVINWSVINSELYAGGKVRDHIMLEHSNPVTVKIGHNKVNFLRKIFHMPGSTSLSDFTHQRADIKIVREPSKNDPTKMYPVLKDMSELGLHKPQVAAPLPNEANKQFDDEIPF